MVTFKTQESRHSLPDVDMDPVVIPEQTAEQIEKQLRHYESLSKVFTDGEIQSLLNAASLALSESRAQNADLAIVEYQKVIRDKIGDAFRGMIDAKNKSVVRAADRPEADDRE